MVKQHHRRSNVSKTDKAGITFPVARVQRFLRKGNYAKRIRVGSAVYLTVVLEYLVAELLELSGNESANSTRKRINPRHIMLAIRNDEEFNKLLKKVTILDAGVMPFVHPVLISKKKSQSKGK